MAEEQVTPEDVRAAEDAAREAKRLALSLEKQIAAGDMTITAEQLEARRAEARFAVLRVTGVKAKLAPVTDPKRQADLVALRAEIDDYLATFGPRQAELLQAYLDALDAFQKAATERTTLLSEWWSRAHALDVPQTDTGRGASVNAGLALAQKGMAALLVDGRTLRALEVNYLDGVRLGSTDRAVFIDKLREFDRGEAA